MQIKAPMMSEWLSSESQLASAGEDTEEGDPRALAVGMRAGAATAGTSLEGPWKVETGPHNSSPGHLSKEMERKNTHMQEMVTIGEPA